MTAGGGGGVWLRAACAADAPAIARLYVATVHAVNGADYSPSQIAAWAAGGADPAFWLERQRRLHTVVAVSAAGARSVGAEAEADVAAEAEAEAEGEAKAEAEVLVGFCEYQAPVGAAPAAAPAADAVPATAATVPATDATAPATAADATAHLDCLYVHHAWIGRGVGSLLLAELEAHARRDGATAIWLEACITARPFFQRRGYQELRRVHKPYRGETFTIFEMKRRLPP